MNYLIRYRRNSPFKYYDEVKKWKIVFRQEDKTLPEFLSLHPDKDIYIAVPVLHDGLIPFFAELRNKYKNFRLCLSYFFDGDGYERWQELKDNDVPICFDYMVTDWATLNDMLDIGVTDVIIGNQLGFELDLVKKMADRYNTEIIAIANHAQSQNRKNTLKNFFIRPEDVELYEQYVDTLEFRSYSEENLNVYYEVYKKGKWFGPLKEIIINLNSDIDNRAVLSTFGGLRINCGWRCMKGKGCSVCDRTEALSKTLIEKGYYIKN